MDDQEVLVGMRVIGFLFALFSVSALAQDGGQLPDLRTIPKWSEIAVSEKFMALPNAEKQRLKANYFDEVIAPHAAADGEDVPALRQKFMAQSDARPIDVMKWLYVSLAPIIFLLAFWKRSVLASSVSYVVKNGVSIALLLMALSVAAIASRALWLGYFPAIFIR